MICAVCGDVLLLPRKKLIPTKEGPAFCSAGCLRLHILTMPKLTNGELTLLGARKYVPSSPADVYSPLLRTAFRSHFEKRVAEYLVEAFDGEVLYEPHVFEVGTNHRLYVPDFYIVDYGVWLEVKGEWRLGGKSKFTRAQEMLGPERLLLIPPAYEHWFPKNKAAA